MSRQRDWRLPAIWLVLFVISIATRTYVAVSDEVRHGHVIGIGRPLVDEITSHLVVAALLPALYWLHRRWPIGERYNLALHVAAVVPFSILHTSGMAALRLLWFSAIVHVPYSFPLTADRLQYEFAKDLVTYLMLTTGVVALNFLLQQKPVEPEPVPEASGPIERFAVRKRGGSEIVVEVADIDWIEASGNYAILHVGGETFEIRSSLTRLEGELDPKRFVRVHKSSMVNIARVAEVTPWVSGDWRIRLQDGAEINLSRRYRPRFEALAPVRS
ncbi:MAG: LytR/AlgR family response regulator transcription factor [Rhodospirillaceae bacterium]